MPKKKKIWFSHHEKGGQIFITGKGIQMGKLSVNKMKFLNRDLYLLSSCSGLGT